MHSRPGSSPSVHDHDHAQSGQRLAATAWQSCMPGSTLADRSAGAAVLPSAGLQCPVHAASPKLGSRWVSGLASNILRRAHHQRGPVSASPRSWRPGRTLCRRRCAAGPAGLVGGCARAARCARRRPPERRTARGTPARVRICRPGCRACAFGWVSLHFPSQWHARQAAAQEWLNLRVCSSWARART